MNRPDKLKALQALNESSLRQNVIIPLLDKMGYRGVHEYHGRNEYGKDIVCFDIDRLKQRRYLAVVAKCTDLTGSISSNSGLMQVLHQAEQCFNEEYHDLFGMTTVTMHEVWIITSRRVIPGAADSIFSTLKKSNLAVLTRIISGETLIDVIDEYFPTYWNLNDSAEHIQGERDRLHKYLRNLLRKIGASEPEIEKILSAIRLSSQEPSIYTSTDTWHLISASIYSLHLSQVGIKYPKGIASTQCGNIERCFREAQEEVRDGLRTIEETLYNAEKVLSANEPHEFTALFNKLLSREYPFHQGYELQSLGSLEGGLSDIDKFLERVDKEGRTAEITHLIESLEHYEKAVAEYIAQISNETFSLTWTISSNEVLLQYDMTLSDESGFVTRHTLDIPTWKRWGPETRRITSADVMEAAQLELREYLEKSLPQDDDDLPPFVETIKD